MMASRPKCGEGKRLEELRDKAKKGQQKQYYQRLLESHTANCPICNPSK